MHPEALPLLVLSRVKKMGAITIRKLIENESVGTASHIFDHYEHIEGLQAGARQNIREALHNKALWHECQQILDRAEAEGITVLTLFDQEYPHRLKSCIDAPPLIFYRGKRDLLSSEYKVSIVGTRGATRYGEATTIKIVEGLCKAIPDLVVVSGLARGIDIIAHRAALACAASTIAVLGFGHHHLYPYEHRADFDKIATEGGLLSEYPPDEKSEAGKFVARNRIIAALAPATIVVESRAKGGALITAEMALSYNHEVFAVPGRLSDEYSAGCNQLIAAMKAAIFNSVEEFLEHMNWGAKHSQPQVPLLGLKPTLPGDPISALIAQEETILFNDLLRKSGMPAAELHTKLMELELEGYIEALPGGKYAISYNL